MSDLGAIRRDYARAALDVADTDADPVAQFTRWLAEARAAESLEPTAMTLATVDAAGRPEARIVLLKAVDARGFVFFSDGRSRKGRALAAHPRAALCFWWGELERQVRVAGAVERVTREESAAYFASRPRESQVSAWTSEQSSVVADRAALEAAWAATEARFAGQEIPLPPHWGGWRVVPEEFEFWQGRPGRFHDRVQYTLAPSGAWHRERLAP